MSADAPARTRTAPHSRARRGWWVRSGLLVVVLLLGGLVVALGARPSSLDRLEDDLAAGEVASVEVRGPPPQEGAQGYTTQEVRWRTGVLVRSTEVLALAPGTTSPLPTGSSVPGQVVDGDVVPGLRELSPDLVVDRSPHPGSGGTAYGLAMPGWLVLSTVGVWLSALLHVVHGPRPWRLSRWGWAWLVLLAAPLGVVLLCLLSGPTAGLPRPRRRQRVGGLGGSGLAVLLGVVVSGLTGS